MTTHQIFEIVRYVLFGILVIANVASFVYAKIKGSSSKFLTRFIALLEELCASTELAEKMSESDPLERKEVATKYIRLYCENNGYPITNEQLDVIVERVITNSNRVNAKERDSIIINDLSENDELL